MPFKFQWLCECLEELDSCQHLQTTATAKVQSPEHKIIRAWFSKYDHRISRTGRSAVAFLSCLLPERRVERVYNVKDEKLSRYFGRALGLGHARAAQLNAWQTRDGDDFPTCLQAVMASAEFEHPIDGHEVMLEELDRAFDQIAANSPFSAPAFRSAANGMSIDQILDPIVKRLQSNEAKWLVRMLLKSYGPVRIPERVVLKEFHFLMPYLLSLQNSLPTALETLERPGITALPARPVAEYEQILLPYVSRDVTPRVGVMISRQSYHKARSIKHACTLSSLQKMSVERKYDGEYCQIHIDKSKRWDYIQIFSKSGKDSTLDRARLHAAIDVGLRLRHNECGISQNCILEGELLVWDTSTRQILPFHKIRKHVLHGGRLLGAAEDSPIRSYEQLMVVFYDVLLLDGRALIGEPHSTRRQTLKALVRNIEGRSVVGERSIIDFASSRASGQLRRAFAFAIRQRWEGLVLKACDEPYFSWMKEQHSIKLKKDYIAGLGDAADLCIIGGRRDPAVESFLRRGSLRWTSFTLACLLNQEEVKRNHCKPLFKVMNELTHHSMPERDFTDLNQLGRMREITFTPVTDYMEVEDIDKRICAPTELFKEPIVVEVFGAGYERPLNCSYYVLRFPRIGHNGFKLHTDRTLEDSTNFEELQRMAKLSFTAAASDEFHEDLKWLGKLLEVDGTTNSSGDLSHSTTSGSGSGSICTINTSLPSAQAKTSSAIFIREDTAELISDGELDRRNAHISVKRSSTQRDKSSMNMTRHGGKGKNKRTANTLDDDHLGTTHVSRTGYTPGERQTFSNQVISLHAHAQDSTEPRLQTKRSVSRVLRELSDVSSIHNSGTLPEQSASGVQLTTRCGKQMHQRKAVLTSKESQIASKSSRMNWPRSQNPQEHYEQHGGRKAIAQHVDALCSSVSISAVQEEQREPPVLPHAKTTPSQSKSFLHRKSGPVWIAPCVLKHLNNIEGFLIHLSRFDSSFTFSIDHFLDAVDAQMTSKFSSIEQPLHFLLVDFNSCNDCMHDLRMLANELRRRSKDRHRSPVLNASSDSASAQRPEHVLILAEHVLSYGYADRILVVDYRILFENIQHAKNVCVIDKDLPNTLSLDVSTIRSIPDECIEDDVYAGVMVLAEEPLMKHNEHDYQLLRFKEWERRIIEGEKTYK